MARRKNRISPVEQIINQISKDLKCNMEPCIPDGGIAKIFVIDAGLTLCDLPDADGLTEVASYNIATGEYENEILPIKKQ